MENETNQLEGRDLRLAVAKLLEPDKGWLDYPSAHYMEPFTPVAPGPKYCKWARHYEYDLNAAFDAVRQYGERIDKKLWPVVEYSHAGICWSQGRLVFATHSHGNADIAASICRALLAYGLEAV